MLTLCACLYDKPLIYTQRQSEQANQVGTALDQQLVALYNYRTNKEDIEGTP